MRGCWIHRNYLQTRRLLSSAVLVCGRLGKIVPLQGERCYRAGLIWSGGVGWACDYSRVKAWERSARPQIRLWSFTERERERERTREREGERGGERDQEREREGEKEGLIEETCQYNRVSLSRPASASFCDSFFLICCHSSPVSDPIKFALDHGLAAKGRGRGGGEWGWGYTADKGELVGFFIFILCWAFFSNSKLLACLACLSSVAFSRRLPCCVGSPVLSRSAAF